jgi:hypothetical protein
VDSAYCLAKADDEVTEVYFFDADFSLALLLAFRVLDCEVFLADDYCTLEFD